MVRAGDKILCAKSESNAQHDRHAHKCSKIYLSRTGGPIFTKLGMLYLGLQPIVVCSNDGPWMTLTNANRTEPYLSLYWLEIRARIFSLC